MEESPRVNNMKAAKKTMNEEKAKKIVRAFL
jgi:hypothetical protein